MYLMAFLMMRKLFEVGGHQPRSIGVTLPKPWLNFWELGKGRELVMLGNGVVVLIPPDHPRRSEIEAAVKRGIIDGFERRPSERESYAPLAVGPSSHPDYHPGTGEAGQGGDQRNDNNDLERTGGGTPRVVHV